MKSCLYDECPNTEDTPGVEFNEVFDSSDGNRSLGLFICSQHLQHAKQDDPGKPTSKGPDRPNVSKAGKQADPVRQLIGSSAQKSNGNRTTGGYATSAGKSKPIPTAPEQPNVSRSVKHGDLVHRPDGNSQKSGAGDKAQGGTAPSADKPKKNRHCCAAGCDVSLLTHPDVGLFKFYPSQKRFEKWCLVADLRIRETRLAFCLCARHFHGNCFVDKERRNLKATSDPSYPTGPLNERTGNYCPTIYTVEPPLVTHEPEPEIIFVDEEGKKSMPSKPSSAEIGNEVEKADCCTRVKKCCYSTCKNTEELNKDVTFFRFPDNDDPRIERWLKAAGFPLGAYLSNECWLCSNHFDSSQFENESTLKPNAVPISTDDSLPQAPIRLVQLFKCDAAGCPVTNENNPKVKFFNLKNSKPVLFEKWKAMVGLKEDKKTRFTLCQYHFPEKAFLDSYRTTLSRLYPDRKLLFPYGPLNPKTDDYCPIGQEELSIIYHKERVRACCVKGCLNFSPLFKFPYYDDKAFDIWCERIGIWTLRYSREYITNILVICGNHFDVRCKVIDTLTNAVYLVYGALPTCKLPNYVGRIDRADTVLKTDQLPPNATELAQSLLVGPTEGVSPPAKRRSAEESTNFKKMKHDSEIMGPTVPLARVLVPEGGIIPLPKASKTVKRWSPDDFIGGNSTSPLAKNGEQQTQVANNAPQAVISIDDKPPAKKKHNVIQQKPPEKALEPQVGKIKQPMTVSFSENIRPTPNASLKPALPLKRGPKKKFEPDDNRPSRTIKEFIDDFIGSMSPPGYSPPPSPDPWEDPLAKTRDACVQTDGPGFVVVSHEVPKKPNKKALEAIKDLSGLDVGNEVDVLMVTESKKVADRSAWSQVSKENALETALIGLFNRSKTGEDNAFSSLSDPSTIPDPDATGHYTGHQYSTYETVNVLRSAAHLCELNTMKVLQLEQFIKKDEETISLLEETIVKHLNTVMCITGVELIRKCFDRVLKDAIRKEKETTRDVTVQVFDGKKSSDVHCQVPTYIADLPKNFSDETKQMCKVLMAYSNQGYTLLKQIADLPVPQLVRYWSTYVDGSPGFSAKAFSILRDSNRGANKMRLGSLTLVDVPLRKDVFWDGKRPFGYEDYGYGYIDDDSIREASKAVVFYLKMLTEDKKLPIAYCLADNLTPQVRANLINQCIIHLDSVGVRCVVVVCDYSVTTHETFVELKARLSDDSDTGWFLHPLCKNVRVMCIADIFENLQALSNLWAEKKIFRPSPKAESAIDLDHIALGDAYLKNPSGYSSVPAMAKFLSEFNASKSQAGSDPLTLNKYNAAMLTILRDLGVKKFASTSQTIKYLESLTAVADIFSSIHRFDIADRRPVTQTSSPKIQVRLASLASYFGGLCYGNGTKILSTNRKLPVSMLKMNLCSLKGLIKRVFYGEKRKSIELYVKRLSLGDVKSDIAEMCGGERKLVTAAEFRQAFKNFLDGFTWTPSERLKSDKVDKFPVEDVCMGFNFTYLYEYTPFDSVSESALEFLTENVIATWIEKVKCVECSQAIQKGILSSRDSIFDGNVVRDIHRLIRTAESCLAVHAEIRVESYDSWFNKFSNQTLNSLTSLSGFKSCQHLFVSAPFGEVAHFTVMAKDMLRIYLQLRLSFMNREERIKIQAPRTHSMKFNLGRSWT